MRQIEESAKTMPPGEYWVGDPCYAFEDNNLWCDLLNSAGIDELPMPVIMEADAGGYAFIASGTAHGDGTYTDQHRRRYPVDAGLIGITPARGGEARPKGMKTIRFTYPVGVRYDRGTIVIGSGQERIVIETDAEWRR
jgi:hypothetical protein